MSNAAMSWAANEHPGKGPKGVLMCLADRASDHSGEDWSCFPSIESIMSWTDYSRPAVERNLKLLWLAGYISRKRRRRADGRLGIYDYVLHRSPEVRAALQDERSTKQDIEDVGESAGDSPAEPHVKMTCGPPIISGPAIRQNDGQPYVKMMGQEPSVEPSREPTTGAREPGDAGFDGVIDLWPDSGRKRTNWGKARAAWAWACGLETAERLTAAVRACIADPDVARGDYGLPGLHTWLSEERWRAWAPKAAAAAQPERIPFAGPPDIEADIARAAGSQIDAGAYLAGAVWRPDDRTVLTRSQLGADRLTEAIGPARLAALDLRFKRAPSSLESPR